MDGLLGNVVIRIMVVKDGNFWFVCGGEDGGICCYNGVFFICISVKEGFFNEGVWIFLEDKEGFFWLGICDMGLYCYDGEVFVFFLE